MDEVGVAVEVEQYGGKGMEVASAGWGIGRRGKVGVDWRGGVVILALVVVMQSGCAPKVQVAYHSRQQPTVQQPATVVNPSEILKLKRHYEKWRGTPYVDGGMSPAGIDCSGYTVLAFRDLFGLELPRTAVEQASTGREIPRQGLRGGDLVFFNTGRGKKHVGIYLDDEMFIHASLSRGVTLSSLDDSYWQERYWQSRRLAPGDGRQSAPAGNLALAASRR